MSDNIKRDEHNINFVPTWLIPTLFVCIVILIFCIIACIVCICNRSYFLATIFGIVAIVLSIIGRYCDSLEWHRNVEYRFKANGFDYVYDLDNKVLPTNKSQVILHISDVQSVKLKGKRIVVNGNIKKVAPLTKPRYLKKVVLSGIPDQHDYLITRLNKYVKSFDK